MSSEVYTNSGGVKDTTAELPVPLSISSGFFAHPVDISIKINAIITVVYLNLRNIIDTSPLGIISHSLLFAEFIYHFTVKYDNIPVSSYYY